MARPLRIEFTSALYHVTSRGDGREDIYLDDADRRQCLSLLGAVTKRFNWVVHAYCLMNNHYHLLVETPDSNLAQGMRHFNGVYTQRFNQRHQRVGHVFQGRYKAILVHKDSYLLELARYIVLNPVRAGMVRSAKDWPWSSYRATAGHTTSTPWLNADWVLSTLAIRKEKARQRYATFVAQGKNQPTVWTQLTNQIYLGPDHFVQAMQKKIIDDKDLSEVPSAQKRPIPKSLEYYKTKYRDRNTAIATAYSSGGYSMKEIGKYFGLHYSRISRIINGRDSEAQGKT